MPTQPAPADEPAKPPAKRVARGMPKIVAWEGHTFSLECSPTIGGAAGAVECKWSWKQQDDYGEKVTCPRCGGSVTRDVLLSMYRMALP